MGGKPLRGGEEASPARQALLEEFRDSREALLQACWAHQLWSPGELRTTEGLPLNVSFPGWLNRSAGPDFTQARLRIGGQEWSGDVEVHLDEAAWAQHGHGADPAYGRVILHVVLNRARHGQALAPGDRPVPVFHAAPYLPPRIELATADAREMLARYASLPGRCGLRAAIVGPDALSAVIAHAAEARARQKSERLLPLWAGQEESQLLFELVFQSLGYRPYAESFRALARRFPLRSLQPLLERPLVEARDAVLARWFGAAGLLEEEGEASWSDGEAAAEHARWRRAWRALGLAPLRPGIARGGSRPWNSPERRMVGMFQHLHALSRSGWLKGWLALLVELDGLRHAPDLRRAAMRALERLFETPPEEPWNRRVSFRAPPVRNAVRLVGPDRAIIVMANAVIPFFLAFARQRQDRELEKLLYRLFILLPPEAPNAKTRFMEARLVITGELPRTLRSQQGLLQIHQDFCTRFEAGCQDCRFPDLIAARDDAARREQ